MIYITRSRGAHLLHQILGPGVNFSLKKLYENVLIRIYKSKVKNTVFRLS